MRKISVKRQNRILNEQKPCSHPENCKNFRLGNSDWCDMHRTRFRRYGRIGPPAPHLTFDTCQENGCDKAHKANGKCAAHWSETERKANSPLQKLKRRRAELIRIGWTPEEYHCFNIAQNGKCAKCGLSNYEKGLNRELAADHCHKTGKRRGLLCHTCNSAIGMLGDSIEGVKEALRYFQLTAREMNND